jgi:hypothetical protein
LLLSLRSVDFAFAPAQVFIYIGTKCFCFRNAFADDPVHRSAFLHYFIRWPIYDSAHRTLHIVEADSHFLKSRLERLSDWCRIERDAAGSIDVIEAGDVVTRTCIRSAIKLREEFIHVSQRVARCLQLIPCILQLPTLLVPFIFGALKRVILGSFGGHLETFAGRCVGDACREDGVPLAPTNAPMNAGSSLPAKRNF